MRNQSVVLAALSAMAGMGAVANASHIALTRSDAAPEPWVYKRTTGEHRVRRASGRHVASDKRAAKKAKNVLRHKAHCKRS